MTPTESMRLLGASITFPLRLVLCLFGLLSLFFPGYALWCLLGATLKALSRLGFSDCDPLLKHLGVTYD